MASFNKIIVMGNLGQDPEVKYTQGGKAYCELSVATSEQWTDKDGQRQENTTWFRCKVWDKTAENCGKYLAKGRQVLVEGRMTSRKYTDKDGNEKTAWEVAAHNVVFVGSKDEGASSGGGGGRSQGGGGQGGSGQGGGGQGGQGGGGNRQQGGGRNQGGDGYDPFSDDPIPF